jgi:hypothetical protein
MSVPTKEQMEALEGMIDQHGLDEVLLALSLICDEKASHIRMNGLAEDFTLARRWVTAGNWLKNFSQRGAVQAVSP